MIDKKDSNWEIKLIYSLFRKINILSLDKIGIVSQIEALKKKILNEDDFMPAALKDKSKIFLEMEYKYILTQLDILLTHFTGKKPEGTRFPRGS